MAKATKKVTEPWTYVLQADRALPIEEQSRFTLGPMTQAERQRLVDNVQLSVKHPDGRVDIVSRSQQVAYALALSNIVAVENFPAGAAKPWPKSPEDRAAYLDLLDDGLVIEIGNEIWTKCSLEPDPPKEPPGETPAPQGEDGVKN